jgi:hypothetical protein
MDDIVVLMVPITKRSYNKIARQLAITNVLRKSVVCL